MSSKEFNEILNKIRKFLLREISVDKLEDIITAIKDLKDESSKIRNSSSSDFIRGIIENEISLLTNLEDVLREILNRARIGLGKEKYEEKIEGIEKSTINVVIVRNSLNLPTNIFKIQKVKTGDIILINTEHIKKLGDNAIYEVIFEK